MLGGNASFYSPGETLPAEGGTYVLVFRLTARTRVKTSHGFTFLEPGIYAYVGSAFGPGGLRARISRHLRREKKIHWHIDWVTTGEEFQPLGVWVVVGERKEKELAELLSGTFKPVPGFGASDSREDSHLFIVREG